MRRESLPPFSLRRLTMGQRLVRAKAKIREARISFDAPESAELPARLEAVLEAIYAVYGQGWEDIAPADGRRESRAEEAFYLTRLVIKLLPDEPEPLGLLALMQFCEARRGARRSPDGLFVPLSEQDASLWSRPQIEEAERSLLRASEWQKMGRFQLEAAIQSVHVAGRLSGRPQWAAVTHLYEGLLRIAPTLGGFLSQAAALAEWRGADTGLTQLQTLEPNAVKTYQPYWALKAHLLQQSGHFTEATHAYDIAIGLTEDAAIRRFLLSRRSGQAL